MSELTPADMERIIAAKNLLAVLHGDGGHHTEKVGVIQSCKDGEQVRHSLVKDRDQVVAELDIKNLLLKAAKVNVDRLTMQVQALEEQVKVGDAAMKENLRLTVEHEARLSVLTNLPPRFWDEPEAKWEERFISLKQDYDALRHQLNCGTCGGLPHASGLPCVCSGHNTSWAEANGLRKELFEVMKQVQALEREKAALISQMPTDPEHQDCILLLRSGFKAFCNEMTQLRGERDAYKFAAEQAAGMHMAENILAERDAVKMKLRTCEEERDALQAKVRVLTQSLFELAQGLQSAVSKDSPSKER